MSQDHTRLPPTRGEGQGRKAILACPADPWEATWEQLDAARLRLGKACITERGNVVVSRPDLRAALHAWGMAEMGAEVCGEVRNAAKRVTGGNCTFADMDLRILEMLAYTAVRAGLTGGLHPKVAATAVVACAAHPFASEGVADPARRPRGRWQRRRSRLPSTEPKSSTPSNHTEESKP